MTKVIKRKSSWQKFRKLANDLHLWIGLAGGIVLFVVCLTGTIYTFAPEIQEILEPGLYKVATIGKEKLQPEQLIHNVEQSSGGNAIALTIPDDPSKLVSVSVRKKEEKGRPTTYQVNPYTGEVAGIRGKGTGADFFFTVFKLHRWLLLDATIGRPIVGVATILFALGCITGLVIWFPQKVKHWRQGLKMKLNGNWKRANHDLHNTLGFYSFVFLLIMALTGLCWSFDWYKNGLGSLIGANVFERGKNEVKIAPVADRSMQRAALNRQIKSASVYFKFPGDWHIYFAKNTDGVLKISKSQTGFFAPSNVDQLYLNSYTAEVLNFDRFSEKPVGEKIAASIRALHMGTLYGTATKILYFISCLIATSLPVTGTLIWWNKLKQKNRKSAKRPARITTAGAKTSKEELLL